jgi:hypothetical protein
VRFVYRRSNPESYLRLRRLVLLNSSKRLTASNSPHQNLPALDAPSIRSLSGMLKLAISFKGCSPPQAEHSSNGSDGQILAAKEWPSTTTPSKRTGKSAKGLWQVTRLDRRLASFCSQRERFVFPALFQSSDRAARSDRGRFALRWRSWLIGLSHAFSTAFSALCS